MVPDYANPQDLNRYSYVRGNPVRFTDPSGHCIGCFIAAWMLFGDFGVTPMAPYYMAPAELGLIEKVRTQLTGAEGSEALMLTTDWYFEWGNGGDKDHPRTFGEDSQITQALKDDEGVAMARAEFIKNGRHDMVGDDKYNYNFGAPEFAREFGDVVTKGDWSTSFLGGYKVEVENIAETNAYNQVEFRVYNTTGWHSATRVWNFSFKQDEPRSQFGPGGNLYQVYIWQERIPK